MPTEPLQFKAFSKCVALSDVIYADMEAILEKCTHDNDDDDSNLLQRHIPCCVGAYWVSKVEIVKGQYDEFKGVNCIAEFVEYLEEKAKYLHDRNKTHSTRIKAERIREEMARHLATTSGIWCKHAPIDGNNKFTK